MIKLLTAILPGKLVRSESKVIVTAYSYEIFTFKALNFIVEQATGPRGKDLNKN